MARPPVSSGSEKSAAAAAKSLQSYLTLCDPIDRSPPGSAVPGILQARTLEWVAIAFSSSCLACTKVTIHYVGESLHVYLPSYM